MPTGTPMLDALAAFFQGFWEGIRRPRHETVSRRAAADVDPWLDEPSEREPPPATYAQPATRSGIAGGRSAPSTSQRPGPQAVLHQALLRRLPDLARLEGSPRLLIERLLTRCTRD